MIDKYVESKEYAWAPATQRSVKKRLRAVGALASANDGQALYDELSKTLQPYSIKTTFYNVSKYTDWLIENGHIEGPNKVRKFMHDYARLFKNSYVKKELPDGVTFEQAKDKLKSITDRGVRRHAELLLHSGLRYQESLTYNGATVVGKGGRTRRVFGGKAPLGDNEKVSYTTLYRELRKIGLTPHMLRKLFATALVRKGVDFKTLMDFMGWTSTETASSYVQSIKQDEMDNLARELRNET